MTIIEVEVKDSGGNPVSGARVDIDYDGWQYTEYKLKREEVLVGGYDPNPLYGDEGNNAVTNKNGYCKLDVSDKYDYKLRVAKNVWLNEYAECDWTGFSEWKGKKLTFTLYRWWINVKCKVKDEKGNPIKNARIDIDYSWGAFQWYDFNNDFDFDEKDVYRGRLEEEKYMDEPYNVVTDENGIAEFFVWKRGYARTKGDDLPNWYRFRTAKKGYLNDDKEEYWSEFIEKEVKLDDQKWQISLTLYTPSFSVYVNVVDQNGNPVPNARIDIDINTEYDPRYHEYKIKEEDIEEGELDKGELFGDSWNIKTNEEGHAKFHLYRLVDSDKAEYYRFRAGKKGYLNKDDEEDWSEFVEKKVKKDTKEWKLKFTLYSSSFTVYAQVIDQGNKPVPNARIDVDVNYTLNPKWYEYDKFKPEDVKVGEIEEREIYGDSWNIKTNEEGKAEFILYRFIEGEEVEYYGFRAAHPDYENPDGDWDWGPRREVKITKDTKKIKLTRELNKTCGPEPYTWSKCIPGLPWWWPIPVGVGIAGAFAVGAYATVKEIFKKLP